MKKMISFFLLAVLILQSVAQYSVSAVEPSVDVSTDAAFYDSIIDRETEFIAGCQLVSGAIAMQSKPMEEYGGGYRVMPYFSNLASLALLERDKYIPAVKKYMDWYFGHLNTAETDYNKVKGTIYDYHVEKDGETEKPENGYDSTDSYPATFFSLLRKYYEVTGDSQYLLEHQSQLDDIGSAMLSTYDNGLTYAKPDYRIQYLMDNAEVHKGLADAIWLYDNVIKSKEKSDYYEKFRKEIENTLQNKLWNEKTMSYANYRDDAGNIAQSVLTTFYSDATAQLYPIWEELISPSEPRALEIYNTFCKNFPDWPVMKNAGDYPWAIMAYTAAMMGDKVKVDNYLKTAKENYIDKGHPHNWYVLEAGMLAMAAEKIKEVAAKEGKITVSTPVEGQKITKLPFKITGSSEDTDKVEVRLTHKITNKTKTMEVNTAANGSWIVEAAGIINGDYAITARAKDKFNNEYSKADLKVRIEEDLGGDKITGAKLSIDKDTLRRGEKAKLAVTAYINNSKKQASAKEINVEYLSSKPELVTIDSKGNITLKQPDRNSDSFEVWAYVTLKNNLVQTNKVTIRISKQALTTYDAILDKQAQWISERQIASGAFTTGSTKDGKFIIDPMDANYVAMGLLGRPEYAPEVKRYIDWYMKNLNWPDSCGVSGTVYNFVVDAKGKIEKSLETNKSSSSLIASFMSLVKRYGDITGDYSSLDQFHLDSMTGGLGIMLSQDTDGLFWVRPNNKIKELGDNAIAIKGFYDSVWLQRYVSKAAGAADYFKTFADSAAAGFEKQLWDDRNKSYFLSMDANGKKTSSAWTNFNQTVEELQPICSGIIFPNSDRAKDVYKKFNKSFTDWYKLKKAEDKFEVAAYASAIMGDKQKSEAFFKNYKQKYIDSNQFKKQDVVKTAIIMLAAEKAGKIK